MLSLLAASTLDKLRNEPSDFWIKILTVIGAVVVGILLIRIIISMSKILLALSLLVLFLGICNWVYQRSEPAVLTPYIDKIAPYFPGAPKYGNEPQKPVGSPPAHKP